MTALRHAFDRLLNPPPREEAAVVQRHAEALKASARNLAAHSDVFAELVEDLRSPQRPQRRREMRKK